ncbi:MAG: flagellar hook-associated protein FlgL, partial [Defluviitaleaceae bacterium]|nr:flagellar hook-associated protein FlgL [Defluviitaleaceae bacterium]
MRITNTMMTNTMLMNIGRNMGNLDTLYNRISTAKNIRVPSDDPITASRALKFRTNVAETLQYQRNVSQGMSWMNVTESAYNNIIDITKTIKDRCGEAATGTLEGADKKVIAGQIRQMLIQLGSEMNVSYAGRYVFSGFRTDQPPVLVQGDANLRYTGITQFFGEGDVEITKSYQKLNTGIPPGTDEPIVHDVNMIKLPYKNAANISVAGYTVATKSVADPTAYDTGLLGDTDIAYI